MDTLDTVGGNTEATRVLEDDVCIRGDVDAVDLKQQLGRVTQAIVGVNATG